MIVNGFMFNIQSESDLEIRTVFTREGNKYVFLIEGFHGLIYFKKY